MGGTHKTRYAAGRRMLPTATSMSLVWCHCHKLKAVKRLKAARARGYSWPSHPTAGHELGRTRVAFRDRACTHRSTAIAHAHIRCGEEAADYASGWHLCLNALSARLDGKDVRLSPARAAREYGWQELRDEYALMLAN